MLRTSLLAASILAAACYGQDVQILNVVPHRYGANHNFNVDLYMRNGWNITTAGVTETVLPCHGALPVLEMDTLLQEVGEPWDFDAIAVMPATWRYQPDPYRDIMDVPEAMAVLETAVSWQMPLWLTCVGPRILAYADLLEGVEIQGQPGNNNEFLQEYLDAGATYLGTGLPPVNCNGIITTTRGQYYQAENCQAIASALAQAAGTGATVGSSAPTQSSASPASGSAIWAMTYGGSAADGLRDACETSSGGFTMAGYTYSFGQGRADIYVVCADTQGEEVWSTCWGGPGYDYANSVCPTADGGYAVAGYTTSQGQGMEDVCLLRLDSDGQLLWSRTYGGPGRDIGRSVVQASDGGFLVSGLTESFGAGESDTYLIRTDSGGDTLWTGTYGAAGPESGDQVIFRQDGGIAVAGCTGSFTSNMDAYLVLTDSSGVLERSCFFGGSGGEGGYDRAASIVQLADGGFLLTGDTNEDDKCGVFLVHTDSNGVELFKDCYGESFYDFGRGAVQCVDGGWLVCGATKSRPSCDDDAWLAKLTPEGALVWTDTHGSPSGWDWSDDVIALADGSYLMVGQTRSWGAGGHDAWVVCFQDPATGIEQTPNDVSIRVSPNPASSEVRVDCGISFPGTAAVYGMDGRKVLEGAVSNGSAVLDVGRLPAGVYGLVVNWPECSSSALLSVLR